MEEPVRWTPNKRHHAFQEFTDELKRRGRRERDLLAGSARLEAWVGLPTVEEVQGQGVVGGGTQGKRGKPKSAPSSPHSGNTGR